MSEPEEKKLPETLQEMIDDSRPVYSGHPADAIPDDKDTIADEEKTGIGEGGGSGEGDDAGKNKDLPLGDDLGKPAEEEKALEGEPLSFKYKSHEEAEKAYVEAEKLITQRAEEAKRERERAEDLQRQLNEALIRPRTGDSKEDIAQKKEELKGAIKTSEVMGSALKAISALDPAVEDYEAQAGQIWGEALEKVVNVRIEEQRSADRKVTEEDRIVSNAEKTAASRGLNMSEGSDDYDLFWAFAETAKGDTFDEQVDWTVKRVLSFKKPVADKGKAEGVQKQNEVLGRGGERQASKKEEPVNPISLMDAFEQTQRRI